VRTLTISGYREIGRFILPGRAWWEYYGPLGQRIAALRGAYCDNPEALRTLEEMECEIELIRRYAHVYGYVFYIMQAE